MDDQHGAAIRVDVVAHRIAVGAARIRIRADRPRKQTLLDGDLRACASAELAPIVAEAPMTSGSD